MISAAASDACLRFWRGFLAACGGGGVYAVRSGSGSESCAADEGGGAGDEGGGREEGIGELRNAGRRGRCGGGVEHREAGEERGRKRRGGERFEGLRACVRPFLDFSYLLDDVTFRNANSLGFFL